MTNSRYLERWREQTVTPFDRMQNELRHTHKWRFIKRKHLGEQIAEVKKSLEIFDYLNPDQPWWN